VPIERWTRAPTPSLVGIAGITLATLRGESVVRLEGGILLERPLGREEKKLGAMFGVCDSFIVSRG